MKIGIDIDDTVCDTIQSMLFYANKYNEEVLKYPKKENVIGLVKNRYYLHEIFGWNVEEKYAFFETYYKDVLESCKIKEDAILVINELYEKGYEIYFASARLNDVLNCDTYRITKNMFDEANIKYHGIYIHEKDKTEFCKKMGIDLFIDDSYETCLDLEQNNIPCLFMNSKMNESIKEESIRRVFDWKEILEIIEKRA